VPPAGAADAGSLAAANALVGNAPGAAGIELTLGRAEFRCSEGCMVAVTGAPAAVSLRTPAAEIQQPFGAAFAVPADGLVNIGPPANGLRSYLAVSGGITTQPELGSRSADLHSGIGGPLRAGSILPLGEPAAAQRSQQPARTGTDLPPGTAAMRKRPAISTGRGTETRLRIVLGPRTDWFTAEALTALLGASYTVGAASNRTGLRLDGPALARSGSSELPSEGVVTGSLQVPHDGQPILLLTDHPTVGGYPVIGVLASADVGLAAQLRPGDKLAFSVASISEALTSAADSPVGGHDVVG
jgi:biotin-dependent carboxylase-like uncharacterized protein